MENLIKFYIEANKLKDVIRTGWTEVGISSDRIESVAEHVYGTMILSLGIISEKHLELDTNKIIKMILIKELEKISLNKEFTPREYPSKEERIVNAKAKIAEMVSGLVDENEINSLFDEYTKEETKEAKFVSKVSKLESDLQAKIYDLKGQFKKENAVEDAKYFDNSEEIIPQIENASDSWILYDRRYYDDEVFKSLSDEIQNIKTL